MGKQKAKIASFHFNAESYFGTQIQKTLLLSLGHSWTALHSHKNQPYALNKTYVLPFTTQSSFSKSVVMSVAVSNVAVVPCRASSEKSKDSVGGISYYINELQLLSKALSTTILFAFQQHSSCMHRCMVCATLFNGVCVQSTAKSHRRTFRWLLGLV